MKAYGQSHREAWEWLGMVFAGLVIGIALTVWLTRFNQLLWLFFAMLLPFLAGIALAVWRMRAMKRARKEDIRATLEAVGYLVDLAPSPERTGIVFAPVAHLQEVLMLRYGAANIDWLAIHTPSSLVFEHSYVTGSGKATTEHHCTVIAVSAAHASLIGARLGVQPWASSEHARFLYRRVLRSHGPTIAIGDAAFDRVWVTLGNAATAHAFFTDRVRQILATSPKGEVWHVGEGFVCCAYRGALSAEHLARMLERAREVLAGA